MKDSDVALIQEPWINRGKIMGLGGIGGELIYSRSTAALRTCILVKKHIKILPLTNFCLRDLTAVKIRTGDKEVPTELTLGSAYLPDYRHINFTIGGTGPTQDAYGNPQKTDWEAYRADLEYSLKGMKQTIWNIIDLEVAYCIEIIVPSGCRDIATNKNKGDFKNMPPKCNRN
ncbi:hypothetical protein NQ318_010783 [Aromia moschata]|uniref:Uncharacterized protein n=1 Tax=Aromia moschata TaxID=1265417 RepID=A0AAV8YZG5_9CUCU|nr:hypothetical protein NQ318_010783 [Aromia moschata]